MNTLSQTLEALSYHENIIIRFLARLFINTMSFIENRINAIDEIRGNRTNSNWFTIVEVISNIFLVLISITIAFFILFFTSIFLLAFAIAHILVALTRAIARLLILALFIIAVAVLLNSTLVTEEFIAEVPAIVDVQETTTKIADISADIFTTVVDAGTNYWNNLTIEAEKEDGNISLLEEAVYRAIVDVHKFCARVWELAYSQ